MATISNFVRWADNTDQLRKNLAQGLDQIEATRAAADKMVQSLSGERLIQAAHKWTAAIGELGGVTKLTASEQERANNILQKAIEKYEALGKAVPTVIRETANQTAAAVRASKAQEAHADSVDHTTSALGKLHEALRLNIPIAEGLTARFTENATALAGVGIAIGTVAVGFEVLKKGFEFGERVAEQAKAIRNLSTETGVAIEPLQILSAATKDFGLDTEQLARGIYQLSRRIAVDDDSASASLRVLGLNIADLKRQSPDQVFLTVVRAVNQIPDPMTRSAIAAELFGARFAQAILAIGPDLDNLIEKVKKSGEFMSEDAVKGAAKFADQIDHLKLRIEALTGEALGPLLEQLSGLLDLARRPEVGILTKLFAISQFDVGSALAEGLLGKPAPPPTPMRPVASHGPSGPFALAVSHGIVEGPSAEDIARTTAMRNALNGLRQALPPLTAEQDRFLRSLAALGKEFLNEKNLIGTGISPQQLRVFKDAWTQSEEAAKKLAAAEREITSATGGYGAILATIPPKTAAEVQELLKLGVSHEAIQTKYKLTAVQVKALATQLEVQKKITDLAVGSTDDMGEALTHLGKKDVETIPQLKALIAEFEKLRKIEEDVKIGHIDLANLPGVVDVETIGRLKEFLSREREAAKEIGELAQAFSQLAQISGGAFGSIVRDIGMVISALDIAIRSADAYRKATTNVGRIAALTGGFGAFVQATGTGRAASAIPGGALVGAELGSNFGPWGTAIGAIAGAITGLIRSIGGPSQKEVQGRQVEASFERQFGGFVQMQKALHDAYIAAGRSAAEADADIQALFASEKRGAEATTAAIDKINGVIDEAKTRTADLAKRTADIVDGVHKVEDAYHSAGGHIPDDLKASIQALSEMNGLTDDERDSLKKLLDGTKPDFEKLTSIAESYGIKLSQLGNKFQQANIENRARKIFEDFTALEDAGADTNGVLEGMADEISKLVNDSKAFKTAIPDNMKPLIQRLIDSGQLLDENGDKIKDMTGINFEDTPLSEGLKTLNDTIQDLIKLLRNDLPKAITDLPDKKVRIGVEYDLPELPPGFPTFDRQLTGAEHVSSGGLVMPFGIDRSGVSRWLSAMQHFQIGGMVPGVGSSETVPALLTPGELVLNARQQDWVRSAIQSPLKSGNVAPIVLQENFQFQLEVQSLDPRSAKEVVEKELLPQIVTEIEDRRRGYAGRLAAVMADING